SKIAKEEERIIEVAMVEMTVIPTSIAECSGPRHAMGNARPSAVEARCWSGECRAAAKGTSVEAMAARATATKAAAVKAASTKEATVTATTTMRQHVRACKSANCKSNCHCNKFFIVHKNYPF